MVMFVLCQEMEMERNLSAAALERELFIGGARLKVGSPQEV
jgi:hypothetical protein